MEAMEARLKNHEILQERVNILREKAENHEDRITRLEIGEYSVAFRNSYASSPHHWVSHVYLRSHFQSGLPNNRRLLHFH